MQAKVLEESMPSPMGRRLLAQGTHAWKGAFEEHLRKGADLLLLPLYSSWKR